MLNVANTLVLNALVLLGPMIAGDGNSPTPGGPVSEQDAVTFLKPFARQLHVNDAGHVELLFFDDLHRWLGDEAVTYLLSMPWLESLDLTRTTISETGLRGLGRLSKLERLSIPAETTPGGIGALRTMQQLRFLHVNLKQITREHLQAISKLTQLRTLSIVWPEELPYTELTILGNLQQLKEFSVPRHVSDRGVEMLLQFSNLTRLDLHECADITDEAMDHLRQFPQLTQVVLPPQIGDPGISQLARSRTITSIEMVRTSVSDGGLAVVASMPQLRFLRLPPHVTDVGVMHFHGHPSLLNITLYGDGVTDATVAKLKAACPHGPLTVTRIPLRKAVVLP